MNPEAGGNNEPVGDAVAWEVLLLGGRIDYSQLRCHPSPNQFHVEPVMKGNVTKSV
jgi:hypothetical protein